MSGMIRASDREVSCCARGRALSAKQVISPGRATDWPMFRGGPALTGIAAGVLRQKLSLLWSFKTGQPVRSSAAIAGGRVYVGSNDANVYCLDLTDGKQVWA